MLCGVVWLGKVRRCVVWCGKVRGGVVSVKEVWPPQAGEEVAG